MSVIGFDIGNASCVIADAKRGGIDVLLNDEDKRETPSVVSFGDKQRFLGSAGAAFATSNLKSTISQIKRLIGRLYNEPSVQADLKLLSFITREGPRGGILVELQYLKKEWTFTPVEILGMLFTHLKKMAEKNLESPVVDCVIGIPSYFTDLQRREYLDAARIAGLRPLRLIHDGTAIALGYGMYKTEFSKSVPTNVAFVDIGHCDTQVTVAAFEQGGMKILSHSFDSNLGGRDFDEVLFRHFAEQFKEKYNIDVCSNDRASIRLRASCEKVKKVLSANAEAPISIECLIDDTDVRGIIKREEFEKLSQELLKRVNALCIKAVKDSGIRVDKINTIELVGSGSRVPAIMEILTYLFNKEPTRTLNASECVARGCALRCAMLSPSLKVRDYKVEDVFPYSIAISFDEVKNEKHRQSILFLKGKAFPRYKMITNPRSRFSFQVSYIENKDVPAGVSPKVGRFEIGSSETSDPEKSKVELKVKLNNHGIVVIESASRTIQSYFVGSSHTSNLEFSENLDVATTKDELREAQKKEQMLAEQDKKVEETMDQRNTLESFVYDTRSKLSSAYQNFASDSEKKKITDSLQKTEDWLYQDSDDESEQDYTGKLQDLKKLLGPVEKRYKDEKARAQVTKALQICIEKYRSNANSLPPSLKEKILYECSRVEQWLNNLMHEDPIHWIEEAIKNFERICMDIIRSKPKSLKHQEFVNSNQRDQSKESDQRDQSEESNQRDQSVNSDQREQSVEETMDQRNTLEFFVYDTRSKLSSAYRNFASDIEKKKITDSLQETEDWLYKDRDDESEQDYTGKLQDLKKLLDPVEKRFKDEKARAQVTKALQICIENYRSYANSSSPSLKEKILYECSRAEQWLNNIPPQQSCLMDENPIHLIEEAKKTFQRNCMDIIQFEESDQRYQSVNLDQRYRSVNLDQRYQSVNSDQRYQSVSSDQRDQSVDSGQRDQSVDSHQKSRPVDSDQKSQPIDSDHKVQPADSTQKGHPVDLTQKGQSANSADWKSQLGDLTLKGQPTDLAQKGQPMESAQKGQPGDSDQTGQPVESDQMDEPEDMQLG